MQTLLSLCFLLFITISVSHAQEATDTVLSYDNYPPEGFYELKKLSVLGDFDGDGKREKLAAHSVSNSSKREITFSPDPDQHDWDSVIKWFYDQEAQLYLVIENGVADTLHLGLARGLYCLINIGDNNQDGKDEIALVVDYLDWSSLNSCKIFSLCNGKWKTLQSFSIHEGVFDDNQIHHEINGYLEKHKGEWQFIDYLESFDDETARMKNLMLSICK